LAAGLRVDARDPQGAELTLALATITVGVLPGLGHRLLGDAEHARARAVVTLGLLQDFLVSTMATTPRFTRGIVLSCPCVRLASPQHAVDQHLVAVVDHRGSTQLALTLGRHLGQDVALVSALALVAARGFFEALGAPL
jgi:hypothetical protein